MSDARPRTEDMAYIGRCGDCDAIVLAIVDTPERKKDVAKEIAQAVREGQRIERVTCEAVRTAPDWGCTPACPCKWCVKRRAKSDPSPEKAQLAL